MARFSDLLPNSLYKYNTQKTSQASETPATKSLVIPSVQENNNTSTFSKSAFFPASAIELYSTSFYTACATGGALSCGLTHMGVTPLDVVKCNMQTDPAKYRSIPTGFKTVFIEQGMAGILRGWVPTLIGYSLQGMCKFGFYEYFKM